MGDHGMRIPAHYRGQHGVGYHEIVVERWSARATDINRRAFEPHVREDDVVVDFGCGSGRLLSVLPARRRIGVEINELAKRQACERGIEVVGSTGDLIDEVADVVISNHALEHTLSPFDVLLELRRLLKPTGRLVLMLPIDEWRKQRRRWYGDPDHHLYTWTPLLLSNLLGEAGFSVEECRVFTCAPFPRRLAPLRASVGRIWVPLGAAYLYAAIRRLRQLYAVAHVASEGLAS